MTPKKNKMCIQQMYVKPFSKKRKYLIIYMYSHFHDGVCCRGVGDERKWRNRVGDYAIQRDLGARALGGTLRCC